MTMTNNVPGWVTPVAWVFIAACLVTAALIADDVSRRGNGRDSVATELVWITSALYLGPFALGLYRRHPATAVPESSAVIGLPGGGASAVAHLVGVPLVLASGLTIAGIDLWVMILVIGVLAMLILFGVARAVARARGRTLSVGAAAGAAVLTVLAFDIGMGGWMLLLHFTEHMPPASEGSFWFLMQIGIVLGLVTGHPVATRLARRHRDLAAV